MLWERQQWSNEEVQPNTHKMNNKMSDCFDQVNVTASTSCTPRCASLVGSSGDGSEQLDWADSLMLIWAGCLMDGSPRLFFDGMSFIAVAELTSSVASRRKLGLNPGRIAMTASRRSSSFILWMPTAELDVLQRTWEDVTRSNLKRAEADIAFKAGTKTRIRKSSRSMTAVRPQAGSELPSFVRMPPKLCAVAHRGS